MNQSARDTKENVLSSHSVTQITPSCVLEWHFSDLRPFVLVCLSQSVDLTLADRLFVCLYVVSLAAVFVSSRNASP